MAMSSHVVDDRQTDAPSRVLRVVDGDARIPNVSLRTCTNCGEHTAFVRDAGDDGWFRCSVCDHFA